MRGPKHVVKTGKTTVLTGEQARELLDSIDTSTVVGLCDRALAFARIGATVAMRVEDYYPKGKRWWVRLHEKGGKRHEMPAHHNPEAYLDAYIKAAGIGDDGKAPLFRRTGQSVLREGTGASAKRVDAIKPGRSPSLVQCRARRATRSRGDQIPAYVTSDSSFANSANALNLELTLENSKNTVEIATAPGIPFTVTARPTPIQKKALELLDSARTQ